MAQPVRTCMSDIDMLDGTYLSNIQFQAFLLSCSGLVAAPDGQGSRTSEASAVNSSLAVRFESTAAHPARLILLRAVGLSGSMSLEVVMQCK